MFTRQLIGFSLLVSLGLSCGNKPVPPPSTLPSEVPDYNVYFGGNIRQANAIYYGGTIITIEDEKSDTTYAVEAVVVKKGVIDFVGKREEAFQKYPDTTAFIRIDLKGRALLPGFFDGHSHFSQVAHQIGAADLLPPDAPGQPGIISIAQLVNTMIAYSKKENNEKLTQWVGTNYDHNEFTEGDKKHPTKTDLDKVSKIKPVVVVHQSGHMGVLNQKALDSFGITDTVKKYAAKHPNEDPTTMGSNIIAGGFIELNMNKLPTGLLEENAIISVLPFLEFPKDSTMFNLFDKSAKEYVKNGFTTIEDGRLFSNFREMLMKYDSARGLKIDVVGYVDWQEASLLGQEPLLKKLISREYKEKSRLRFGGIKFSLDGSPQGKTGHFCAPYADPSPHADTFRGYSTFPDNGVFAKLMDTVLKNGWHMLAHCNGDASSTQFLHTFDSLTKRNKMMPYPGLNDHRSTIIHGQFITKAQIDSAKNLKMSISSFPMHTYYWGDTHLKNLGQPRTDNMSPTQWLLEAKIPFSIHSDAPVVFPRSIPLFVTAIARKSRTNRTVYGANHRLKPHQALRAMTLTPAYHHFEDKLKGSIKVGKIADFVILDKDPLKYKISPDKADFPLDLHPMKVLETIKDGVSVFSHTESPLYPGHTALRPK